MVRRRHPLASAKPILKHNSLTPIQLGIFGPLTRVLVRSGCEDRQDQPWNMEKTDKKSETK
jgi:hypothetical protein